jgi:predicted small metal-binding protein
MFTLKCGDAGFDCQHTIKGNSKEEVMSQAMKHGKRDHNLKNSDFSPELVNKIENLIVESK